MNRSAQSIAHAQSCARQARDADSRVRRPGLRHGCLHACSGPHLRHARRLLQRLRGAIQVTGAIACDIDLNANLGR